MDENKVLPSASKSHKTPYKTPRHQTPTYHATCNRTLQQGVTQVESLELSYVVQVPNAGLLTNVCHLVLFDSLHFRFASAYRRLKAGVSLTRTGSRSSEIQVS